VARKCGLCMRGRAAVMVDEVYICLKCALQAVVDAQEKDDG